MTRRPLPSPSCQSCGIVLKNRSDFGTTAAGVVSVEYCRYCYDKGELTEPDITMEEMIEKVAKTMSEQRRIPIEKARESARGIIPDLKRWRGEAIDVDKE